MIFVGLGDRMRGEPGGRQRAMGSSPAISGQPFPVQRLYGGNEHVGRTITTEGRQRERVVLIGRHRDEPRRAGGLAPQHTPQQIAAYQNVRIDAGRAELRAAVSDVRFRHY